MGSGMRPSRLARRLQYAGFYTLVSHHTCPVNPVSSTVLALQPFITLDEMPVPKEPAVRGQWRRMGRAEDVV